MKVLFLESSPIWINGLPNGFRDEGHEVMISGPLTEQNIPQMLSEFCPDLVFTMGWGPEQMDPKPIWIRNSVSLFKIPLIYWAVEDPAFTRVWSLPFIQKLQPDFVFTVCPENIFFYQKFGINAAHLDFGFHPSVHYPVNLQEKYHSAIAVVANAYPHVLKNFSRHYRLTSIKTLITPLMEQNLRIDFYGKDWDKAGSFLELDIPSDWIHGYLPYTEAHKVYSSAKIVLGLQNYPNQVTQRTYEILGSGGFFLTQDILGIRRLFVPGRDLVISSSGKNTLRLVDYYLEHSSERQQIREKGQLAVKNHTYIHRAKYILDVLIERGIL